MNIYILYFDVLLGLIHEYIHTYLHMFLFKSYLLMFTVSITESTAWQLCKINSEFDNNVAINVEKYEKYKQKLNDNFISNENTRLFCK